MHCIPEYGSKKRDFWSGKTSALTSFLACRSAAGTAMSNRTTVACNRCDWLFHLASVGLAFWHLVFISACADVNELVYSLHLPCKATLGILLIFASHGFMASVSNL